MENKNLKCLCGVIAKSSQRKSGEIWYRCGKEIDYKTERQKQPAYQNLGCNLQMKEEMVIELNKFKDEAFQFKKCTPKCRYHHLFAKLYRVNDPEKESYGKWYYVCNAQSPDTTCNFFKWFDDEQSEEEQEEEEEERPPKKFKKSFKKSNSSMKRKTFTKKSR